MPGVTGLAKNKNITKTLQTQAALDGWQRLPAPLAIFAIDSLLGICLVQGPFKAKANNGVRKSSSGQLFLQHLCKIGESIG